jgi:hypothetical protein
VTVLLCTLVETLVATTVTPGTTAPLGSVTTPEIEPVMAALAVRVPRSTAAATPAERRNSTSRFTAPDLSNMKLWRDPKPNDDKEN